MGAFLRRFGRPSRSRRVPRARQRGFSLHEMLVTLGIAGVLGVSGGGLYTMLQRQRLTTELNVLFTDIQLARSEALKRRDQVVICRSRSGSSCERASAWHEGWILFADADGDEQRDADEPLIRVQQALGASRLRYGEVADYAYLRYRADGAAYPNATFTFCDVRGRAAPRAIVVLGTGRARVADTRADGSALTCG